jgi:hypothetical protein
MARRRSIRPIGNLFLVIALLCVTQGVGAAAQPDLPVLLEEGFEQGAARWQPTDTAAWKLERGDRGMIYHQFQKMSAYEPPHRSPYNIALLKDVVVSDFVLDVQVRSTHPDYGHRDVCLFFGYQDPAHFYYVHLSKQTDDHANQIFIVNDAPRIKISAMTTPGTPWDDAWHHVRIVRQAQAGTMAVYFDNMDVPVMTATDTTFRWGQVGLGSFDDTSAWDDVVLRGNTAAR